MSDPEPADERRRGRRAEAAAAHITGAADPGRLCGLDGTAWRVVDVDGGTRLAAHGDYQLHHGDLAGLPARRLTGSQGLAMVGVLAACRDPDADHPHPGRVADVGAVLTAVGGGTRPDRGRTRHVKGALRQLQAHGLVRLGTPGEPPTDAVGVDVPVRAGPVVAALDGAWVERLVEIADDVADQAALPVGDPWTPDVRAVRLADPGDAPASPRRAHRAARAATVLTQMPGAVPAAEVGGLKHPSIRPRAEQLLDQVGRTLVRHRAGGDPDGEVVAYASALADDVVEVLAADGVGVLDADERAAVALVLLRCVALPATRGHPPARWSDADGVALDRLHDNRHVPDGALRDAVNRLHDRGVLVNGRSAGVRPGPAFDRLTVGQRRRIEEDLFCLVAPDDPITVSLRRRRADDRSSP